MIPLALACAFLGMVGLCAAMDRHHRQLLGRVPTRPARLAWRISGSLGLALSLLICSVAWGWAMGMVAWFGMLAMGGLVLVFLLPYASRALRASG